MATPPPAPLLSLRAAVALLIAALVGIISGALAYLAYGNIAGAALLGVGAVGTALALIPAILGK